MDKIMDRVIRVMAALSAMAFVFIAVADVTGVWSGAGWAGYLCAGWWALMFVAWTGEANGKEMDALRKRNEELCRELEEERYRHDRLQDFEVEEARELTRLKAYEEAKEAGVDG